MSNPLYTIKDYAKRYMPTNKSGEILVNANYVKLPLKLRGDGYAELMQDKRGPEVFGVWCALLEKATHPPPEYRGKLLNRHDEPALPAEIAISVMMKKEVVEYALRLLVHLRWVELDGEVPEAPKVPAKVKVEKDKYLEFVYLAKEEHQKLIDGFNEKITNEYIARLNGHIGSKGTKYKSHYHTICQWLHKAGVVRAEKKEDEPFIPCYWCKKQSKIASYGHNWCDYGCQDKWIKDEEANGRSVSIRDRSKVPAKCSA